MRLIDWAGVKPDTDKTPYRRIAKARETFIKYLPTVDRKNDNAEDQPLWSSIFETSQNFYEATWWSSGLFAGGKDGVPLCADVQLASQRLLEILEQLLPDVGVAESHINLASDSAAPRVLELPSHEGDVAENQSSSATPAVVPKRCPTDVRKLPKICTCFHRSSSSTDVVSAAQRCMFCILVSYRKRGLPLDDDVTDGEVEHFEVDHFHTIDKNSDHKRFKAIGASVYDELRSAIRCQSVDNYSPLDERILHGQFPVHTPKHLPEHGDAYRLFFEMLLATLPLDTVKWVEDKNGVKGLPKNTQAKVFHRRNWKRFQEVLGAHPSLYNLHNFTIDWLKQRCPEGKLNDFKWHGFTITPLRIEVCVTCAIYEYGMARLSLRADVRRDV